MGAYAQNFTRVARPQNIVYGGSHQLKYIWPSNFGFGPVNFHFSFCFIKFWVCKMKFEQGKSCFVFRAVHRIQYNHKVCPERVLAMTHVTLHLPHLAKHPNHCFQNRQLAVHHCSRHHCLTTSSTTSSNIRILGYLFLGFFLTPGRAVLPHIPPPHIHTSTVLQK